MSTVISTDRPLELLSYICEVYWLFGCAIHTSVYDGNHCLWNLDSRKLRVPMFWLLLLKSVPNMLYASLFTKCAHGFAGWMLNYIKTVVRHTTRCNVSNAKKKSPQIIRNSKNNPATLVPPCNLACALLYSASRCTLTTWNQEEEVTSVSSMQPNHWNQLIYQPMGS